MKIIFSITLITSGDLKKTKDKCWADQKVHTDGHRFFICRIGGAYKSRPCIHRVGSSTAMKPTLKKSLLGFDDPSQHHLTTFFRNTLRNNGTIFLIGDSIMKQFVHAFTCELMRTKIRGDLDRGNILPLRAYLYPDKEKAKHPKLYVDIEYYNAMSFAENDLTRIKALIEVMIQKVDSLVIVFNAGVWYNADIRRLQRRNFQEDFKSAVLFFNLLKDIYPTKKLVFVYMETGAQHFDGMNSTLQNGYIPKFNHQFDKHHYNATNRGLPQCSPVKNLSESLDWRNFDAKQILSDPLLFQGPKELFTVAHFRDLTETLHDFHVEW